MHAHLTHPTHLIARRSRLARLLTVALTLAALVPFSLASAQAQPAATARRAAGTAFRQVNLVSDQSGRAGRTDARLINPWGIVIGGSGLLWIADNNSGVSTVYSGNGAPGSRVITIPPPAGGSGAAAPTGLVLNTTGSFVVSKGKVSRPSVLLYATEDGTISGWNPAVDGAHAILAADNSKNPSAASGAVYKGLASGTSGGHNYLYATNFRAARIDVFDARFHAAHLSGAFHDSHIPAGYAPFGIRNLGGALYVTYAIQNAEKHDDVAGAGHGFVDVYSTSGHLLRRLVAHGALNSPWGLAIAPSGFGAFGGDLLVGNFGDGHINAYNPRTGALVGELRDASGHAIVIEGLWGLRFGNGHGSAARNRLYFTAGIGGEQHGLFGYLSPI